VLCLLAAVAGAWLVALNVAAASGNLPYALHGRAVHVVIRRCGAAGTTPRTCRGDYPIGSRLHAGQEVVGADSALPGQTVRATVDGRHPAKAVTGDPGLAVAEATVFALAGLAVVVIALRAARRAWVRRRTRPLAQDRPARPDPAAVDDPLARVRRRRFGA
jgi:hypothetical protein